MQYLKEPFTGSMQGKTLIIRMAGAESFIKKDEQVATLTTDKTGKASVSNLYLGKYYLKEITPPVGYLLDEEEHDVKLRTTKETR